MRSTTTLTIRLGGCGTAMPQRSPPSTAGAVIGEIEIIGTLSSLATATIAIDDGDVAVPISRSTLFSSTSLRALRVAVDGSDPSTALAYAHAALIPRSY